MQTIFRRRSIACSLAVGVLALAAATSTTIGAADGGLSFVDTTSLAVTFDSPSSKPTALVGLVNAGSTPVSVVFSLLLQQDDKPITDVLKVTGSPTGIDAEGIAWFTITFERTGDFTSLTGDLIASAADASGAPAVRPITVTKGQRILTFRGAQLTIASMTLPGGPGAVLGVGLAVAFVLVVLRAIKSGFRFAAKIGSPKWSFDSWVTNVTAAGALLGTVLGAGFFPASPVLLTTGQFAGLHVLSGALILVGPLLYQAFGRHNGSWNGWLFLVAALVAFSAAFTELLTLLVALADSAGSIGSGMVAGALLILCLALFVLVFVYGWQAMAIAFTSKRAHGEAETVEVGLTYAALRKEPSPRANTADTWSLF
jgi:hypothetical protein